MPILEVDGRRVFKMDARVGQQVQQLMAENGYPVTILATPSDRLARYWDMFAKAITHVEDKCPKHFPNPARKIQIRYHDGKTRHDEGLMWWRTVRFSNEVVPKGWYACTPIGKIDGEVENVSVAHGPYTYRRALSLVRGWLANFWGPDGKNAQADFWLGEAEEDDIEVIRSAPESVAGIVVKGMEIHEIAIDRRDGRTLWENRYPKA